MAEKDTLDRLVAFLAKREGIDKTLKLLRYLSRLLLALEVQELLGQEPHKRLSAFEGHLGAARKAFRLGKFLQNVNALRRVKSTGYVAALEVAACTGEGLYYFVEQLVWLQKAGALRLAPLQQRRLTLFSAWSEMLGYMATISLNLVRLRDLWRREQQLLLQQAEREADMAAAAAAAAATGGSQGDQAVILPSKSCPDPELAKELAALRTLRMLRRAYVMQDMADALLALNDLRGSGPGPGPRWLAHPVLLSLCGLLSASVSTYKYWSAC